MESEHSSWPPAPDIGMLLVEPTPIPPAYFRIGGLPVAVADLIITVWLLNLFHCPTLFPIIPSPDPMRYWLGFGITLTIGAVSLAWCASDICQSWRLLKRRGLWVDSVTFLLGFVGIAVTSLPAFAVPVGNCL